eukprot:8314335-Alexandrium_andersonii.AAC.1
MPVAQLAGAAPRARALLPPGSKYGTQLQSRSQHVLSEEPGFGAWRLKVGAEGQTLQVGTTP